MKARFIAHNVESETSLSVYEQDALQIYGLVPRPQIEGKGLGYEAKDAAIRTFNIGFLLALHSNRSAFANRLAQLASSQPDRRNYFSI